MEKSEVIKKMRPYLKKNVNWKPHDPNENFFKEYDNEPYVLLSGRNSINSSTINFMHFVDKDTARAMFKFSCNFIDLLLDLNTMEIVDEQSLCICNIKQKDYKKIKCYHCKKHGACDYWFCKGK